MGLPRYVAQMILAEHVRRPITGTIVSYGNNTVHLSSEDASELLASFAICPRAGFEIDHKTYGRESLGRALITMESFFASFSDAELKVIDVSPYEGADLILDLNEPIPSSLHGIADFVYDGSVLDNLFNPAMGLKNAGALAKADGRIVMVNDWTKNLGRGSYVSMSPDWYLDYFAANNFADVKLLLCKSDRRQPQDRVRIFEWEPVSFNADVFESLDAATQYFFDGDLGQCTFRKDGPRFLCFKGQDKEHVLAFSRCDDGEDVRLFEDTVVVAIAEKGPGATFDVNPSQLVYRDGQKTMQYMIACLKFMRTSRRFSAGDYRPFAIELRDLGLFEV